MKMFDALDFITELTQHIPPRGVQLIRRYAACGPGVFLTNQRTLVGNGVCRRTGAKRVESVT